MACFIQWFDPGYILDSCRALKKYIRRPFLDRILWSGSQGWFLYVASGENSWLSVWHWWLLVHFRISLKNMEPETNTWIFSSFSLIFGGRWWVIYLTLMFDLSSGLKHYFSRQGWRTLWTIFFYLLKHHLIPKLSN